MEQVFKNASELFSNVVVDEKEVALVLFDEKRRAAGEFICYKHSYFGDISESENLNYLNHAFQTFIMKYQKKIELFLLNYYNVKTLSSYWLLKKY